MSILSLTPSGPYRSDPSGSQSINMLIEKDKYRGYAVYSNDHKPLGVVSSDGERKAICNFTTLPEKIKEYLIAIEDKRFYRHNGIDMKGVARAVYANVKARRIVQGGSTITQQLARNLLRDNKKNIVRKLKELQLALRIERQYFKDEILDLYFNEVFWGGKIYGLRAASLEYFAKEPEQLTSAEQLALLTILRGPNYYINNSDGFAKRYRAIGRSLCSRKVLPKKKYSRIRNRAIQFDCNSLGVFRNESVPHIASAINESRHTIITTLDKRIQHEATRFVSDSIYPTSIICIYEGRLIAVASSNGTDYPFTLRANVGSTLKPFIFTFLRESGISGDVLFPTGKNHDLSWDIREMLDVEKSALTLKEALYLSNNNVFVNAVSTLGIEKTLTFLAQTMNKKVDEFVPASVLGATTSGITLHELVTAYHRFFIEEPRNPSKEECLAILRDIAKDKLNGNFQNVWLKTGTTNQNRERYGIVGAAKMLFGFLRQGNAVNDYSKEGNFLQNIVGFLRRVRSKIYKWE